MVDQTALSGAESNMRRDRILVIYNPRAGARRYGRFLAVIRLLEAAGAEVEVRRTSARGDAEAFAREARQRKVLGGDAPDIVVVAGGDGTINEVANGMAGGDLPLAILPLGTANVLAAEIGLAIDPEAIAGSILGGPVVPVYLGSANGHRFTLMAGVGLDAEVVRHVSRSVKRVLGKGAYVIETLRQWVVGPTRIYRVTIDGVAYDAASVVVAKARFYGGRFVCAPAADIREPILHVCLFEKPGRLAAARYMIALANGSLPRRSDYRIVQGRAVSIEEIAPRGREGAVQADGDVVATVPARIELTPDRLPLIHPA